MPDHPQLALVTDSPSIISSSHNPGQIMIPTSQGLLTLDPVTWSSRDIRATTHHGGRLVGHPPHRQTWVLRVPTLVLCYSDLIYHIDAPFRLQDQWIHNASPPRFGGRLYASLYLLSGFVPCFPHADSRPSYRPAPLHVPIGYQSHSLALLCPISSSSAELYFLSSIIISPVSLLACMRCK